MFGPLVVVRLVEALAIGASSSSPAGRGGCRARSCRLAIVVGVGDMAGNAFFVLAAQAGRLDVASVLSSLYPVTTIVLAAVLLRDRVTRVHALGIVAAATAIVLIAGG